VLRQPLEEGTIVVSRSRQVLRLPARFMLVAAMNPCPCGYLGHPLDRCRCEPGHVERYRGRVSGPLLDRIDLRLEVPPLAVEALRDERAPEESSREVRSRVSRARLRQQARGAPNAELSPRSVARWCHPDPEGSRLLERA